LEQQTTQGVTTTKALIPVGALDELKAKVSTLNKRAARLKLDPLQLVVGATKVVAEQEEDGRRFKVQKVEITLVGRSPVLPRGWRLVARIQLLDGVSLTHTVPGETVQAEFRDVGNRCDHCQINRNRNDVFVLADQAGKHVVVGRTCIQDFLGSVTPQQLAWAAEAFAAMDLDHYENGEYGGYGRSVNEFNLRGYVASAACAMRLVGWVSRAKANTDGGASTSDNAMSIYMRKPIGGKHYIVQAEDEALADEALAWAAGIDPDSPNDYLRNLQRIAELSYVPVNVAGLAASIVNAYHRDLARATASRVSNWVGEPGQKGSGLVVVERIAPIDSPYGYSFLHMARSVAGNLFKWFQKEPLVVGKSYQINGMIKSHEEYRGVKETVLKNVKFKEV
jgi:hypothetical protein